MWITALLLALFLGLVATDGLNTCFSDEVCASGSTSLDFRECGITDGDIPDLAACFDDVGRGNISQVSLHNNELTTLPIDFFDGFVALKNLYLPYNKLTTLAVGLFDGLVSLDYLNLSDNLLSALPSGLFSGLRSMRSLQLPINELTTLPVDIFEGLVSLEYLELYKNDLATLPAGVFDGLGSLIQMELGYNNITALPAGIFDDLASLYILSLNHNRLSTVPAGLFDVFGALVFLCSYECIHRAQFDFRLLQDNQLTTLPTNIFYRLVAVEIMNLNDNELSTLPAGLFDGLEALRILFMNDNTALQCIPDTVATTIYSSVFDGDEICECPEDPICDEDGLPCDCQAGSDGYSCAPGSSSSELNRGFTCPSSALVEARTRTTVEVQASGFDERTSRKGCRPDGCTPQKTRDNRRGANSRWSCKGDIVEGNGGCCIEYHFDEHQDIVVMKIAFYKGAERVQTLNAYHDGEFHSQLISSGSTSGYQTFGLNTDSTTDIKLCLDDYENNVSQWLSILEVQFMVLA